MIETTPTGRFPNVRAGTHPLRAAVEAWRDRGDTTPESARDDADLASAQLETARDLLATQEAVGVDLLGDGYVPIYDEWFAWTPMIAGVEPGSLIRYLDTNTYYHRWRLTQQPRRLGPSLAVAAYRYATTLTQKPIKPCLFGPYTLWSYAVKDGATSTAATFDALVDIWAEEVADLATAGARFVQIDESVLLRRKHRGDLAMVIRAIRRMAHAAPRVTMLLHLSCGVIGDLLPPLLDVPELGGIGLDFTDVYRTPNLAALAGWHGAKLLQAGIVDARQVRMETPEALGTALAAITSSVPADCCLATPSTALLYLPRHTAFEKLQTLVTTARRRAAVEVPA